MPEDFYAASNSYLQIVMTVYDSDGVSRTLSRYVYPKKVQLTFNSEPSGLEILLEGISFITPVTLTTWQNQRFTNMNDQGTNKFASQSIGSTRKTSYLVPTNVTATTITAYFRQSLRPTRTPVNSPMEAPATIKIPTALDGSSFAPVSKRNWFNLFWTNFKSIFRDLNYALTTLLNCNSIIARLFVSDFTKCSISFYNTR